MKLSKLIQALDVGLDDLDVLDFSINEDDETISIKLKY